ncbi:hypothetical protein ABZS66_44875 [Dactylosporangium sp. NPDC005572]|uniref:hypothetical protein n=1 Tax=Dactylosporangium sp. NPDC005572 TaxID=3156889 RepID=UPI0033B77DE5
MNVRERLKKLHLFGFVRRHLSQRLRDTFLHRNVLLAAFVALLVTWAAFAGGLPALAKVAVKDFSAGVLAFSALGFGASASATVLALAIPKNVLYFTMISNGVRAPRLRIENNGETRSIMPVSGADTGPIDYGVGFRSLYGDLTFVFLWTMTTQLFAAGASLLYFAIAGDLNMVDRPNWPRSATGLAIEILALSYAILQMGSLIRAMADYAAQQEAADRRDLGLRNGPNLVPESSGEVAPDNESKHS